VGSTSAGFAQLIRDDLQRWATVIREKGIKVEQ